MSRTGLVCRITTRQSVPCLIHTSVKSSLPQEWAAWIYSFFAGAFFALAVAGLVFADFAFD
jgi:hypothetical protein